MPCGEALAGSRDEKPDGARTDRHRGIARRGFERRFQLAGHIKVAGADLANGLLTIELEREVPEEPKPLTMRRHLAQHVGGG